MTAFLVVAGLVTVVAFLAAIALPELLAGLALRRRQRIELAARRSAWDIDRLTRAALIRLLAEARQSVHEER